MKFIFPQNYDLNSKILGIIEYSAAVVDLIWGAIVFAIINVIFRSVSMKIFGFIVLFFPVLIFSIVGVNGENLINYIFYMTTYFLKQKIYFYNKD